MESESPELFSPELRSLVSLWWSHCEDQLPPFAADLEVPALRPWLAHLAVAERQSGDGLTIRYFGARLVQAFGDRLGGRLSGTGDGDHPVLVGDVDAVFEEGCPVVSWLTADGDPRVWERLVLPLRNDRGQIDKILMAAYQLG